MTPQPISPHRNDAQNASLPPHLPPVERQLISIVTPCFNEEESIEKCYQVVKDMFANELADYDYEHIFSDNCSTDRTVEILKRLGADDLHVRIIVNSRNFGSTSSLFNAILSADGDAVLTMLPADLQDPPELIPHFVKLWAEGYEVVYGVRAEREESRLMATARRVFYYMVNAFADTVMPRNAGEFQLVDRKVIHALRQCNDYFPYIRGLIANCGFRSVGVPYTWRKREHGKSKAWTFSLIDQGLNGLISFSKVPMRCCLFAGLMLAIFSIGYALFALIASVMTNTASIGAGIPTLIVGLFFLSGVQLFFLGVIGEYIMAIHFQVRKRPLVIERERINFPSNRQRTVLREIVANDPVSSISMSEDAPHAYRKSA